MKVVTYGKHVACGPDGATTSGFRDPYEDCVPDHFRVSSQMPDFIASTYPLQKKSNKGGGTTTPAVLLLIGTLGLALSRRRR